MINATLTLREMVSRYREAARRNAARFAYRPVYWQASPATFQPREERKQMANMPEFIRRMLQAIPERLNYKQKAQQVIQALKNDPEHRLTNARHPEHQEAMSAWNEAHEIITGEPLVVETPEPENRPYVSRLVREVAEQPDYHRQEDAKQALAEIFDDKKWAGPDGKGQHPLFDGNSPRHAAAVEEFKALSEMAQGKEKS